MPVPLTYPGVYVREEPSGVVSISAVPTSIALFMGMTERGPMRLPRTVLSFRAFETLFGSGATAGELADQVRQFFLNGGGQAIVMRMARAGTDVAASSDVENEFGVPTFRFTARDAGAIGNTIRFEVDYETSDPESTFNLTIYREVTGSSGQIEQVETETFKDLSGNDTDGRYVVSVLRDLSNLLTAQFIAPGPALLRGGSIGGIVGDGAGAGAATADLMGKILIAINATPSTVGRFDISVDGQPYVTVGLPNTVAVVADIQVAINNALAPIGRSVTVDVFPLLAGPPHRRVLRIRSDALAGAPQSSVRIRRAAGADDIAGPLQLGTENGGFEWSEASNRRPMPNGIVANLGAAALPDFASLTPLLRAPRNSVTGMSVTDAAGVINAPIALVPGANEVYETVAGGDFTFDDARTALDAIVTALNTAFAGAPPPRRWRAVRSGLRIVLRSLTATADFGPGTVLATILGGAYNFNLEPYLDPATRANVQAYRLGYAALPAFVNASVAGQPGTTPVLADFDLAYDVVRREVDIFNMLILPRNIGQLDTQRIPLWGPASAFCKERRAVLLMDPPAEAPSNWRLLPVDQVAAQVPATRVGVVRDHTALYWPMLRVVDPTTGLERTIDPAGSVAGVMARIDGSRGVWKAGAGLEASVLGIRGVQRRLSDGENGLVNPLAVNVIRAFPAGTVVWGARTMDGFDNSGNTDYRYLPVRRTALLIEESLYRGLQFAIFEPNDERLWAQIRLAAGAFMNGLFRQGAFQGTRASDAYDVKCDEETTTQTDINLGVVNVIVRFAPLRPCEFVVLVIKQKAGQVQV